MHRWKLFIVGLICMGLITGCWDKVEIDKRAFITMFGVEKYEEDENVNEPQNPANKQRNRYTLTLEYANTGLIAGKVQGKPDFLLTSQGVNADEIVDIAGTRMNKSIFFGHLKAVIVGEKFAQDQKLLRELLDVIERSPTVGRKVHLMITPNKMKDVLDIAPEEQPVLGLFIRDLMQQKPRSPRIADADLGYILRSLHESKAAIAPRIIAGNKEIKIAGAGVLKDYKLVGWLGEKETSTLMFMLNKIRGSQINVKVDELLLPIEITDAKTKMKVYEKDGTIIVSFDVTGEGNLSQHLFEVRAQPLDHKYIEKVGKAVSKNIEEQIKSTYKKIQDDYGADLVQAGEYLRKHEPDTWEKVKGDWDEIFPKTKVEVSVDMKIRRVGVTQ